MDIDLRDYFAAHCPLTVYNGLDNSTIKALNQFDDAFKDEDLNGMHAARAIAIIQYQYADIMINARNLKFQE